MFLSLAIAELLFCLLLGGGTRDGFLSDAILQLLSIPVFLAALWRVLDAPLSREKSLALGFCAAIVAVPLVQLIPLPPWIWTHLRHREIVLESFELLGRSPSWAPISMTPEATYLAALSLLPPVAIFLATLTLDRRERRVMSLALVAFSVVSVFLGLLQLAQGPTSHLRFFEYTNQDDAVGFFANRNHFAALLYCAIALIATVLVAQLTGLSFKQRKGVETTYALGALAASVALAALIVGETMARSRAGILLMIVALLASVVAGVERHRALANVNVFRGLAAIIALAILLLGQSALFRLLDRFDVDALSDARLIFAHNTVAAATSVMPTGSGIGSFPSVYATVEKPADLLAGRYANHAHNDLLEMWLETGLVGPTLLILFLIWLTRKGIAVFAKPNSDLLPVDRALLRASILIILLLLAHSLVDYPLRTSAMTALFAFACGLLIDPPVTSPRRARIHRQPSMSAV